MTKILERAGASFLRAWVAALIVLLSGILAAPNLTAAYDLGLAALGASIAAGCRALQVFVPQLSFTHLFGQVWGAWADAFTRAFLGTFLTLITGALQAPDLSTARTLATAALVGAVTAGVRALQGLLTKGEWPAPATGVVAAPPSTP